MHETLQNFLINLTMAISPSPSSLLLITLLFLLTPIYTHSNTSDALLSELINLRSQSPTGVIHLNDSLLQRILSIPSPKPFSSLIFFDAKQLHSKSDINLPAFKREFSLLSSSFLVNHPKNSNNTHIFFFVIEFQESQSSFALFELKSLPHFRLLPFFLTDLKRDSVPMDASGYSRGAESMKEFVEANVEVNVGPIHRPPAISKKMMAAIGGVFLIWSPFLVKKIVSGDTLLHDKYMWMTGSIFVYFFSVSGTMHSIIRKVPMYLEDRNDAGKMIFFYQASGMQLGTEGFAVGFLYMVVGLLLAFMTHVLVCVKDRGAQRLLMALGLIVSFWAVKKVIYLDNWKTGYGIHAYWPSSWM
ncbi:probable dolichyl-diphosphooligosaccharide--protein glycosyltransferase subunit 3B [Nicotiana tomentosiformis]|uniref:probable dolichyl-diphosphooligosaccharide--protein glycosyltransferase subunit 3B n=1 Tax=Nicotiana tomentosiformis TaxID=4098 RepID=UPI00051C6B9F|nr:probable dolichyl-diphosphooligosaccharide--protein glycosyltransferase subunit 3B [Nicotiana tomentosiformis]